ncbi:hypothetical protein R77591_01629 [Ralstonia mannitolilytica]|uniref:Uncharacterized protein n=1 Tax=Ralstonia mannitolilytica TaxID=105219 RepID=A0AAD2AL81_9RALS|nr:hypothetical protein R77591_01629 [Ralstonia mannitolilytica]CAJ0867219.1 hypothetical protein R77569_01957 [Ralstonia mannitolilytica]
MRLRPFPARHLDPSSTAYAVHGASTRSAVEEGACASRDGASATDARRAGASPRPVIRGESAKRQAGAIVDWLRFTFLPDGSICDALEQLRRYFHLWFAIPVTMKPSVRGFRGYEFSHDLMAFVNGEAIRLGIVACGGESVGGTMLVVVARCSAVRCRLLRRVCRQPAVQRPTTRVRRLPRSLSSSTARRTLRRCSARMIR